MPFDCLVDVDLPERDKRKGGRPRLDVLEKLAQACYHKDDPDTLLWRCSGAKCGHTYTVRLQRRFTRHAAKCSLQSGELRALALLTAEKKAPGTILENLTAEEEKAGTVQAVKVRKLEGMGMVEKAASKTGRARKNALANLKLVIFICTAGICTYTVERKSFRDFVHTLDSGYNLPHREQLETEMIPGEAARIRRLQLIELEGKRNLTVSFDGGTSTGREAFWTVHVSTAEGRKVYLLDAKEATSVSHTAEWIKDTVLEVCLILPFQDLRLSHRLALTVTRRSLSLLASRTLLARYVIAPVTRS